MRAEPGGGGRPRQGRGQGGAGLRETTPRSAREPDSAGGGQPLGAGLDLAPPINPAPPRLSGSWGLKREPGERRALPSHAHASPTRRLTAQAKEGNERPRGGATLAPPT